LCVTAYTTNVIFLPFYGLKEERVCYLLTRLNVKIHLKSYQINPRRHIFDKIFKYAIQLPFPSRLVGYSKRTNKFLPNILLCLLLNYNIIHAKRETRSIFSMFRRKEKGLTVASKTFV